MLAPSEEKREDREEGEMRSSEVWEGGSGEYLDEQGGLVREVCCTPHLVGVMISIMSRDKEEGDDA